MCDHCRNQKNNNNKVIIKKKKKHDKIGLLGKDMLKTIEVLISKALIDSYISHDEFVSVNDVLREYNEMKEEKCFYPIALFVARKNQILLKIKNSTILIIFKMISLKWIK